MWYMFRAGGLVCALVLVSSWRYWASIGRYWLVLVGSGTVYCGNGWPLVVLGQYRGVLVACVVCFQKVHDLYSSKHVTAELSAI